MVAVAVAAACFVFNAAVSGEFNYQGGERKYMVNHFVLNIAPGVRTEAVGLIMISPSFKRLTARGRSFNIFIGDR